jgi:hypothetical protein
MEPLIQDAVLDDHPDPFPEDAARTAARTVG